MSACLTQPVRVAPKLSRKINIPKQILKRMSGELSTGSNCDFNQFNAKLNLLKQFKVKLVWQKVKRTL